MRKNRTKHEAKKPRLAKRALALCFALIFVCSCLLPVFAHSEEGLLEPSVSSKQSVDDPTEGGEDPVLLTEGGEDSNEEPKNEEPKPVEPEQKPAEPEQKPEEPKVEEQPKTEGTTGESKDSTEEQPKNEGATEETKPEGTTESKDSTEEQPKNEGTTEETKTEETKPEEPKQPTTNTTGDAINQGEATYTYRFWPDKIDALDLEAINAAVKAGETLNEVAQSRVNMVPCTVLTVMTNAHLSDYSVTEPTKDGYEFKGWYTVDGTTEDDFSLDQNVSFEESKTIDVFAKWEKVESTVEDEMEKTEPTTEDELDKTESGKANESKEETLSTVEKTGAVGLMINEDETASITVKAENLPGKVNELVVTDLNEDDDAFDAFESAFGASNYAKWNVTNLMVNITPEDIDGNTVQPSGAVRVTISDLSQLSIGTENIGEWKVLHLTKSDEIEALNVENTTTAVDSNGNTVLNSITFETTSFSPFVVVAKGKVVKTLDLNSLTLSITDNVKKNGRLVLNITDSNGNEVTTQQLLDGGAKIKWYRNGTEMHRDIVTHGTADVYNMAADNSWVNVAADKGSGVTYRVAVTEGTTVLGKSKTVNQYNTELKNGSFETPIVVNDSTNDQSGWGMQKMSYADPWRQTDQTFEVANTTYTFTQRNAYMGYQTYKKTLRAYGCETAADKNQFAELNGDGQGTLYQDVLVTPGTTMFWQFYHRMRKYSGTGDYTWNMYSEWCKPIPKTNGDTMAMIIGPLEWAENITKQADVNNFIAGKMTNGWYNAGDNDEYKVYVYFHNTKNQDDWDRVSGQIQVPDDWGAVRFFFGAVSTGCGDPSVGNLLDAVHFSTTPNPVPAGDGQITVTKNIYGMTLEEVKQNLSGANKEFIEYQGDLSGSIYFSAGDWTLRTDGYGNQYVTATATVDITGIEPGTSKTLAFSENEKAKVNGYDLASEWAQKKQKATVGRNDNDNTSSVTVTNTYKRNTLDVTVTKKVPSGDTNREFYFKFTGDSLSNKVKVTDTHGVELVKKHNGWFVLKDNESAVLRGLEAGDVFTIEESYCYLDNDNKPVTDENNKKIAIEYDTTATSNKSVAAGSPKSFSYAVLNEDGKLVLRASNSNEKYVKLNDDVITDGQIDVTNTLSTTDLTVTKRVAVGNAAVPSDNREFTFRLTVGTETKDYKYVTFDKAVTKESGYNNVWTFTLKANDSIKISGIRLDDTNVKVEEVISDDHYTTKYSVNGTEAEGKEAKVGTLLQTGNTVVFTNTYSVPNLNSMTIKKVVTGAFGERTKAFTFNVTLTDKEGHTVDVTHLNVANQSSFSLKHDQQVELKNIPINTTITVTEKDAKDYKTSATGHSNSISSGTRTFTYEVVEKDGKAVLVSTDTGAAEVKDSAIIVENNFDGNPDTGVLLDTLPYLILLAVAVAGGVLVVVRKRKHRDE